MIKVYKGARIETGDGEQIEVSAATVAAAKNGNVTDKLRRAVRAALGEAVFIADGPDIGSCRSYEPEL